MTDGPATIDPETIERVLQTAVAQGDVAGVAAIVVDAEGVRWQGAAGERTVRDQAMTVDTVGQIFSMTKPLTAVAVVQAVEAGLIDLDAPAGDYHPDLAAPMGLAGFDGDTPILRPATAPVTVRQLLTHTSGYVYELWNADMLRWYQVTDTPYARPRDMTTFRTPLSVDPGTRWEYGTGIDWAGFVLEKVVGRPLGEIFAERVCGPLAMVDTAFEPTGSSRDRLASVHMRRDGGLEAIPTAMPDPERELDGGGGGLFGTVGDYGRFARMILRRGELDGVRILEPESFNLLETNQMGDLRVERLDTTDTRLSVDAEFFPREEKSWSLGFQIHERDGATGRKAGTMMWAGLANSMVWIDPTTGIAGVFMSQHFPFGDARVLETFYDFERAVYDQFS